MKVLTFEGLIILITEIKQYFSGLVKNKVDKTDSIGLSTNDFSDSDKEKLDNIADGDGQTSKVWKTDANGVPGWRTDSNTTCSNFVKSGDGENLDWFHHRIQLLAPQNILEKMVLGRYLRIHHIVELNYQV